MFSPIARCVGTLLLTGALVTANSVFASEPVAPTASQKEYMGYADGALVMNIAPAKFQIESLTGIVYAQVKNLKQNNLMQLHMNVMVPKTKELKPAVIFFPGGGFASADRDRFLEMRYALAQAGFVVASVEYRVIPYLFPCLVEDGKAAVRYLRAHAEEFGIDPNKIGVIGDSAGGYVAQMVGTTNGEKEFDKGDFLHVSSDVQASVSIYGISDLSNIGEGYSEEIQNVHKSPSVTEALLLNGPAFNKFPGAPVNIDPDKVNKASPITHVDKNDPPMLLMHGNADTLVSPWQSANMYKAQKEAGVDTTYIIVEGAEHADLHWYQKPIFDQVISFFEQKLGKPSASKE